MPPNEYSAVSRGTLKLKGQPVKDSRVEKPNKKKKHKRPKPDNDDDDERPPDDNNAAEDRLEDRSRSVRKDGDEGEDEDEDSRDARRDGSDTALHHALADEDGQNSGEGNESGIVTSGVGKTEAEKRHEERRRKRVSGCADMKEYPDCLLACLLDVLQRERIFGHDIFEHPILSRPEVFGTGGHFKPFPLSS